MRSAPWWTPARALLLLASLIIAVVFCHSSRDGLKAAVFTIDVDRFKQISDTYGHPVGDECLKVVAQRLGAAMRRTDVIARTGGEELTMIAGSLMHAEDARRLAAEMLQLFCEPIVFGNQQINLTISIGAAVYPSDAPDPAVLRNRSEQALYQAKRTGRNRVVFATEQLSRQRAAAMSLELSLRRGLFAGGFFLSYQPILDASGTIRHFEALLRSRDPEPAQIGPAQFILAAEENGLIVPLGHWVLEQVCKQFDDR